MSAFSDLGLSISVSDPLTKSDRSGFIKYLIPASYSHEIRLLGGYYSATISLFGSENEIDDWLQSGVGRHVEVYNSSLERIWEGFVDSISVNFGENTYSIGPLSAIGNKVAVVYSTIDYSTYPPGEGAKDTTAYADNSTSQTTYGVWEKIQSIRGATLTEAEQIRDMLVNDPNRAFPYVSSKLSSSSSGLDIQLKCLGYWSYLNAYYYTNTTAGGINLSEKIQDVLNASPNGIFASINQITTNTTQVPDSTQDSELGETVIKKLNDYGDSSGNPYHMGIYNNRVFYYAALPTEIEYQKRRGQRITDNLGGIIQPWDVRPAKWLFQPDMLVGRNSPISSETLGSDPRAMLIDVVKYTSPYSINLTGIKYSQIDQLLARNGVGL